MYTPVFFLHCVYHCLLSYNTCLFAACLFPLQTERSQKGRKWFCSEQVSSRFWLNQFMNRSPSHYDIQSRDITLLTKVQLAKAMVFPVVMHGCESWTIKKAEHQRIDAFEMWCWRRLLRVLWTERKSNQSILKEINPEDSLEGMMLKLKRQYFGHLMQRTNSLEKIESRRRRGQQRMRWLDGITESMDMISVGSGRWWRTGRPVVLLSTGSHGVTKSWTRLSEWTTTNPKGHAGLKNQILSFDYLLNAWLMQKC